MRILYIGDTIARKAYLRHRLPSQFLYGACEMEQDGHCVIWEDESSSILNDLKLIWRYKPEIIFIPNLNFTAHFLLLLLSSWHILRTPIYVYLHREPRSKQGLKGFVYKQLLSGVTHIFFLSEKTKEETVRYNLVEEEKCSLPGWGADLNYYKDVQIKDCGYFVSTGKENRDFDILIEAFKRTGAPLKIITARTHAGINHEWLIEKCKEIPNIEVSVIDNTGDVYPVVLNAMANAHALVCSLRQDHLTYCVGLSSVVDAEVLNKPLIITYNPYHSVDRMKSFRQVVSLADWEKAIKDIASYSTTNSPVISMQNTYQKMMLKISQQLPR